MCIALRHFGVEAFSCDVESCSGGHPEWHIQADVLPLINGYCTFTTMDGQTHTICHQWDLLIAHPPCTYMSNAGACRMYPHKGVIDPDRLDLAMKARSFFMEFYNAQCAHICIENPRPLKVVDLPKETQHIQPYEFGEPYSKLTLLWLKGLPDLVPTNILSEHTPYIASGTSRKDRSKYGASRAGGSSKSRSKTFEGIANAMACQWTTYLNEIHTEEKSI